MGKAIKVAKGKEILEIDSQDLPFAVKDGYLPTQRIIVANPKTKESFEIDPKDYLSATQDGFSFQDVAPEQFFFQTVQRMVRNLFQKVVPLHNYH